MTILRKVASIGHLVNLCSWFAIWKLASGDTGAPAEGIAPERRLPGGMVAFPSPDAATKENASEHDKSLTPPSASERWKLHGVDANRSATRRDKKSPKQQPEEPSYHGSWGEAISMRDFKAGMLAAYATPRDAFSALDATLTDLDAALDDDPLSMHEFIRGGKTFKPPLSKEQAIYAFRGLDSNADGSLSVDEFVRGVRSGEFFHFPTMTLNGHGSHVHACPVTMKEFKTRMFKVYDSALDAFTKMEETTGEASKKPLAKKAFAFGTLSFQPPMSEEEADCAFEFFDADHDGFLASAEFVEGLSKPELLVTGVTATTTVAQRRTTTSKLSTTIKTTSTLTTTTKALNVTKFNELLNSSTLRNGTAPITMEEFKTSMNTAHATAMRAFQAFDANPIKPDSFMRGVQGFKPSLTEEQAAYAFRGLDADNDGVLPSFEFFEVLEGGKFFPSLQDLAELRKSRQTTTTKIHTTTALERQGMTSGKATQLLMIAVALAAVVACCEIYRRMVYNDIGNEVDDPSTENGYQAGIDFRAELLNTPELPARKRRSGFSFLACCTRGGASTEEETPVLEPRGSSTAGGTSPARDRRSLEVSRK